MKSLSVTPRDLNALSWRSRWELSPIRTRRKLVELNRRFCKGFVCPQWRLADDASVPSRPIARLYEIKLNQFAHRRVTVHQITRAAGKISVSTTMETRPVSFKPKYSGRARTAQLSSRVRIGRMPPWFVARVIILLLSTGSVPGCNEGHLALVESTVSFDGEHIVTGSIAFVPTDERLVLPSEESSQTDAMRSSRTVPFQVDARFRSRLSERRESEFLQDRLKVSKPW